MILHHAIRLILFIVLAILCDGAPSTTELCSERSYDSLYQLLQGVNVNSKGRQSQSEVSITVVTFATSNIASYAAFAFAINWVYCSVHGHDYLVHSPETGSQYELNDQRWNRVKILHNLLLSDSRPNSYFVWTDADLVMTDTHFKFGDIIDQHNEADIIISAERHAETGVANTGCFIIRNSPWSRAFLAQWWGSDRGAAHDQIFFDRLYRSLLPGVRDHVVILPTTVLNTVPPAYLPSPTPRFQSVLHLMGEADGLRAAVFRHGWRHLCGQLLQAMEVSGGDDAGFAVLAAYQLDLSPPILARIAHGVHSNHTRSLMTVLTEGDLAVAQSLSIIAELRQLLLLQGQESSADSESTAAFETEAALRRMYTEAQAVLATLSRPNDTCIDDVTGTCVVHSAPASRTVVATAAAAAATADPSEWVEALNTCATVGNDLLQSMEQGGSSRGEGADQEQSVLYKEVEGHLSLLSDRVGAESAAAVAEMRSVLLCNKGDWLARRQRLDEAVDCYRRAVEVLAPEGSLLVDNSGVSAVMQMNPFRLVHPLRSLAHGMCLQHNQQRQRQRHQLRQHSDPQLVHPHASSVSEAHISAWRDVVRLYDQLLLHAGDQLRADHFDYAAVLADAVRCVGLHGDGADAEEFRRSLLRLCSVGSREPAFSAHCSSLLSSLSPSPPPPPVEVSVVAGQASGVRSSTGAVKRMRKRRTVKL